MHRPLRSALVGGLAVAPLVLVSLASAADTTLGSTPTPTGSCIGGSTLLQVSSTAPSFTVSGTGVITSYRVPGDPGAASIRGFKVARPTGAGAYRIIGSTSPAVLAAGAFLAGPTRVPVVDGDVIGIYNGYGGLCSTIGGPSEKYNFNPGDLAVGSPAPANTTSGLRLSVSAVVEPDVDADGYGDSTQDKCLGTTAINPCFLAPLGKPSGKARVRKTLTAPTVATAPGVTASYQWIRVVKKKHKTVLKPIAGATGSAYKVRGEDRAMKLEVQVTLSAPGFGPGVGYSGTKRVH